MSTPLDDVLGHLPEADRANYVRIAGRYGLRENAPELISAALILEAVGARIDRALVQMDMRIAEFTSAERSLPESMRDAGAEILKGMAGDIASQAVEAFAAGGAETIRVGIMPALLTVAADHRATMEAVAKKLETRAVNFSNGADKAKSDLVVAATDVRNKADAIGRLYTGHLLARAFWAIGAFVFSAVLTLAGTRYVFHAQCVAHAQHLSTHELRASAIGVCP